MRSSTDTYCVEIKGLAGLENPEALQSALAANKPVIEEISGFFDRNGVASRLDAMADGTTGFVFRGEARLARALARFVPTQKVVDAAGNTIAPTEAPVPSSDASSLSSPKL